MTPVELSRTVLHAVRRAVDAGELSVAVPARAVVTPPGPGGAGDYATNIALQLARPAGQPPLRVAEVLRPYLAGAAGVTGVEITGPGFLNISLDHLASATGLVQRIRREGLRYGHTDTLAGHVLELRVPFEVRAEVLADALARIVASQGGRVATHHRPPGPLDEGGRAEPAGISRHRAPLDLRPQPAPEDPTPLGLDAACWALLHPAPHDRPRITADHLVQRESNPLFRVRYAHARTRALTRNAADLGFTAEPGPVDLPGGASVDLPRVREDPLGGVRGGDVAAAQDAAHPAGSVPSTPSAPSISSVPPQPPDTPLAVTPPAAPLAVPPPTTASAATPPSAAPAVTPPAAPPVATPPPAPPAAPPSSTPTPTPQATPLATPLLTLLADYPRILATVTTLPRPDGVAAPSRLARYLVGLADATLVLLPVVLPVGEEKPSAAHRARLALAEAAGTVLAGGLSLLGIDAPDHL